MAQEGMIGPSNINSAGRGTWLRETEIGSGSVPLKFEVTIS